MSGTPSGRGSSTPCRECLYRKNDWLKLVLGIGKATLDGVRSPRFNVTVRRWLFAIVALLVLIAVLYVCISPAIDLDPTITRAWQLAILLISSLAYFGRALVGLMPALPAGKFTECFSGLDAGPPAFGHTSAVLLCPRLC